MYAAKLQLFRSRNFFLISGFIIAYSLQKVLVTPSFCARFIIRRILRLTPPYWAAIALTLLVNLFSNYVLTDRTVSLPKIGVIIAHAFFLQDILKLEQISPVFWTLCLEIQFYFVFLTLLVIEKKLSNSLPKKYVNKSLILQLVFIPLAFISIAIKIGWINYSLPGLFFPYWYIFFIGVLIQWVAENKVKPIWLWIFFTIILVMLIFDFNIELLVILATTLIIYISVKHKRLDSWLSNQWFQYFGKISYSLYLIHLVVGMRILNLGYRITDSLSIVSLIWFTLAFSMSILAAHLMYLFIEKPSLQLSKKLKT